MYNLELYSTHPFVALVIMYTSPLEAVNWINFYTTQSNFLIIYFTYGVRSRKFSALRKLVQRRVSSQSKMNTQLNRNLRCWYFLVGSDFIIPMFMSLLIYRSRICQPVLGVKTLRETSQVTIYYFFYNCWVLGRSIFSLL